MSISIHVCRIRAVKSGHGISGVSINVTLQFLISPLQATRIELRGAQSDMTSSGWAETDQR